MESKLLYSNSPLYLSAFLLQYNKQVKEYGKVNWTNTLSYQSPFLADTDIGEETHKVCFPFMGKNCWLWKEEYAFVEPILDRVLEMTIVRNQHLGVGPPQPIWDHNKPTEQLLREGIEEFQHDLLSATFKVYAVLSP